MNRNHAVSCLALVLSLIPAFLFGQAFDGLTLYNTMSSRTTYLITNSGQAVKTWTCNSNVAYMPYLMPDSTIWRPGVYSGASLRPPAYGGLIEQYSWNGNVIKSFLWSNADHQQHHDIQPMPNGNVLVLSLDRKTRAEAQAMGRTNISASYIWSEEIVEYDPVANKVVWEWHFWDHLIQDVDPSKPNYGVIRDHPERLNINVGTVQSSGDWIHANAVDYWEEEDLIVVSSHYLNEIYVIDHSTTTEEARGRTGGRHGKGGDFLYRWGNPRNYGRGASTDQRLFVVHGVNWIRPGLQGEGNILLFNNGDRPGTTNDYSSVEEITPPRDSAGFFYIHRDSAFGPVQPTWIYQTPGFYCNHLSGAYRMPNGNTFITEGTAGRVREVTPAGAVVWTYNLGAQTGRAIKYPRDFATGLEDQVGAGPLHTNLLEAVAPNPFRASTAIRYNLPGRGRVTLEVIDAAGRVVEQLVAAVQEPGTHSVGFLPARNVPAGVYFVRFELVPSGDPFGRRVETRQIVKER